MTRHIWGYMKGVSEELTFNQRLKVTNNEGKWVVRVPQTEGKAPYRERLDSQAKGWASQLGIRDGNRGR